MSLYEIENISKNGHVFMELRGVQTLKPGQKKVVELSDADRFSPGIVALEGEHIEVRSYTKPAKAEKKAEEPKKEEVKKAEEPKKA